ncbi:MAG TPA: GntR family transcriptional regulator [Pyrinomonadaceae bacterium]|jgi:GntR family transcriptional regulator|nr:GntR family transcriptional regulator [Pyrinomonadaceae bacterium]
MRLWLSKNSEVPIREQLVTQIVLGIVSNDLKVNERLPSTRDLARRYDIHANTVSAAYRELAHRGWVEFRKGSGVYVRARTDGQFEQQLALDQLISRFFRHLREDGHSLAEIQDAVRRSFLLQRPDHFLLLESDPELREILVAEIAAATKVNVKGAGPADLDDGVSLMGATPLVLYGHLESFGDRIDPQTDVLVLHSASVVESIKGQTRPPADALVAIVSRWPEFLRWARTMLVAAGLDADALSFRDARERGWEKGLRSATFVITDSLMAPHIPAGCEVKLFRVLAQSSLQDIRDHAERFF